MLLYNLHKIRRFQINRCRIVIGMHPDFLLFQKISVQKNLYGAGSIIQNAQGCHCPFFQSQLFFQTLLRCKGKPYASKLLSQLLQIRLLIGTNYHKKMIFSLLVSQKEIFCRLLHFFQT